MSPVKHVKATILARRASKGTARKRTRPEPRQYTVADLERAQDRVEAAERRIANDRISTGDVRGWNGRSSNCTSSRRNYACAACLSDASTVVIAHPSVAGYQ
jgi:hypothetical protein